MGSLAHKRRGVSLGEIIVALGLLAVAALALLAAFTAGMKMMAESRELTMATEVGREFLEAVESNGYQMTTLGVFHGATRSPKDLTTGFPPAPYPSGRRNQTEYRLRVDCQQYAPNARSVEVQVSWGRDHHISLATLVHQ